MAAPNRYQYDIPSVQAVNPTLPARLGLADLNCTIAKGDVISRKNLVHAKGVALILSGLRSKIHFYFDLNPLSCTQVADSIPLSRLK